MLHLSDFDTCRKRYNQSRGVYISALDHCRKMKSSTHLYLNKQNLSILSCLIDFVVCSSSLFIPKWGSIPYRFPEIKVLYLTLKSVRAVEMTKYVHWTCINIKMFMLD